MAHDATGQGDPRRTMELLWGHPSAASPSRPARGPKPALTVEEIKEYVQLYAHAAKNAISAGFDGQLSCLLYRTTTDQLS